MPILVRHDNPSILLDLAEDAGEDRGRAEAAQRAIENQRQQEASERAQRAEAMAQRQQAFREAEAAHRRQMDERRQAADEAERVRRAKNEEERIRQTQERIDITREGIEQDNSDREYERERDKITDGYTRRRLESDETRNEISREGADRAREAFEQQRKEWQREDEERKAAKESKAAEQRRRRETWNTSIGPSLEDSGYSVIERERVMNSYLSGEDWGAEIDAIEKNRGRQEKGEESLKGNDEKDAFTLLRYGDVEGFMVLAESEKPSERAAAMKGLRAWVDGASDAGIASMGHELAQFPWAMDIIEIEMESRESTTLSGIGRQMQSKSDTELLAIIAPSESPSVSSGGNNGSQEETTKKDQ